MFSTVTEPSLSILRRCLSFLHPSSNRCPFLELRFTSSPRRPGWSDRKCSKRATSTRAAPRVGALVDATTRTAGTSESPSPSSSFFSSSPTPDDSTATVVLACPTSTTSTFPPSPSTLPNFFWYTAAIASVAFTTVDPPTLAAYAASSNASLVSRG